MERALAAAAARLGLAEEPGVLRKASEYERLLQARVNSSGVINETCKNVICLHLAANTLGIGVDVVSAIKYSGVKKPAYLNMFSTAERLLQLKQTVTVRTVCLQQQCVSATNLAARILDEMSRVQELDTENPQYVCMAVYQACRLSKIKVSKSKLIATSRLKPAQWAKLEADWGRAVEKCVEKGDRSLHTDVSESLFAKCDGDIQMSEETTKERKNKEKIEDFETWKRRILEDAYKELKLLHSKEKDLQKKEKDLQTKERDLQKKEKDLQNNERDVKMKERDVKIKERDLKIKERDVEMKERDAEMKEIELLKERQVTPRKSPRKRIETPPKQAVISKIDRTKGVRLLF